MVSTMDDVKLVTAAKAGDMQAFIELVRRYHGALLAAAQQITGSADDAEDVAQEAVIHAYRHLQTLQDEAKFRAWLFAICRRESINYLRRRHGDVLPLEDCPELPAHLPTEETGYAELLSRLPLPYREVLAARYFYDLSYDEMAEIFDSTSEAMRTRCFRARAQMRELVQRDEEETRRVLYGALAAVTAAFPLEPFLQRISSVLARIPAPSIPVHHPAAPAAGSTHAGLSTVAHVTAMKIAGGVVTAVVVVALTVPHLPMRHHLRKPAKPAVTSTAPARAHDLVSQAQPDKPALPTIMPAIHPIPLAPVTPPSPAPSNPHPILPTQPAPVLPHPVTPLPAQVVVPMSEEDVAAPPARTLLQWHSSNFTGVIAYSPRETLIAAVEGFQRIVLYHSDGTLVRAIDTGQSQEVSSIAFSPDGQTLAAGSYDTTVTLWRVRDGALLRTLTGHRNGVYSLAFSPDGQTLASDCADRTIQLWSVDNGACLHTFTGHGGRSLAFSPNGQTLASGNGANIDLVRVSDGVCVNTLTGHTQGIFSLAFAPDGQTLASTSSDYTVKLWKVSDGACLQTLEPKLGWVMSVAFAPDGNTLVCGCYDQSFVLWDANPHDANYGARMQTIDGRQDAIGSVASLAFTPDGKTLITGSWEGPVSCWRTSDYTRVRTIDPEAPFSYAVAFSPREDLVASGNRNGSITLRRTRDGVSVRTLTGPHRVVYALAFSPDGQTLATGSFCALHLWRVSDGTLLKTLPIKNSYVQGVAFSPDGRTVATGTRDRCVRLWDANPHDAQYGTCLQTFTGHTGMVNTVAFSTDGQTLASASDDHTIKLWQVSTGACLQTFSGHTHYVYGLAFAQDGKTLASGSWDSTIKIWRVSDGACLQTLKGHHNAVNAVAFAPSGTVLASGSMDRTIKLWRLAKASGSNDVSEGVCLQTLTGNTKNVNSLAFSPHGRMLVSGSDDGLALWKLDASIVHDTVPPTASGNR